MQVVTADTVLFNRQDAGSLLTQRFRR